MALYRAENESDLTPGTEFMGETRGRVPPHFLTGLDIISFIPPTFCDKK